MVFFKEVCQGPDTHEIGASREKMGLNQVVFGNILMIPAVLKGIDGWDRNLPY